MKHAKLKVSGLFIAITIGLSACGQQANADKNNNNQSPDKIVAVGSTALQPLVEQAAHQYQTSHPDAQLAVQGGGSGTGLSQVAQGAVTIGNADIFAEAQSGIDAKQLVDHQVAVVGITPVVNPAVTVKALTMNQLRQIFTGKVKNWQALGGPNQAITVVNRATGSGTRATFEAAVLKGQKAVTTQEQDANGTVRKIVATTPGAISYLAFSYVNATVKALPIDGVAPTAKNVTTNRWKIWAYEHMYTKGQPTGATKQFLNYMLSPAVQTNLVSRLGYISITRMQVKKSASNQVTPK